MNSDHDFEGLLHVCAALSQSYSEGLIFIGGIAIYLHASHYEKTQKFAETTHDGDFMISLADLGDMRSIEEITQNRRIEKQQLIKGGYEFDVYTEHQNGLPVAYAEAAAHSVSFSGFRVACLEHLLVLKTAAFQDRGKSPKGAKDARDLIRLALLFKERPDPIDVSLVDPYWDEKELNLLRSLGRSPVIVDMVNKNSHEARHIRAAIAELVESFQPNFPSALPSNDSPSKSGPSSGGRFRC